MPSSIKALQEFFGMINYYDRFRPAIAATVAPLFASLKGKPKDLKWSSLQEGPFCNAKNALSTAAALTFPNATCISLFSPPMPSTSLMGQSLSRWSPVHPAYWPSSVGNCPRLNLPTLPSTTNCCRCIWLSVTFKTSWEVRSSSFIWTTCLWCNFGQQSNAWSTRQCRHISTRPEYNFTLQYVPGIKNPIANALLRNTLTTIHLGLDYKTFVEAR
ncbi:uncharacterized protein [Palaemon carinicauda]|uniref:uncharacterized protein n=1 Tax=Palaemon carinicauda TaxID=392227 RepID=UPI0035B66EB4